MDLSMGNLGYGAFPTHPGSVLKDEIEERGISQRQLAESMGLTYSVVNEILNGRRPLSAKTALMFEAALDLPADSLMYLQTKYNLQTARKDSSIIDLLKGIRKMAAVKQGIDPDLLALSGILKMPSVDEIEKDPRLKAILSHN